MIDETDFVTPGGDYRCFFIRKEMIIMTKKRLNNAKLAKVVGGARTKQTARRGG